jgi:hypothetical protein
LAKTEWVGSIGRAFKAQHDVAIEVLPQTFVNDRHRLVRCEREADTLASINHPNIAPLID